jgi:hypothetical protein
MSDRTVALIADDHIPGLWRVRYPNGELSIRLNRSRASDLALALRQNGPARRKATEKPNRVPAISGSASHATHAATDATGSRAPPRGGGVPR